MLRLIVAITITCYLLAGCSAPWHFRYEKVGQELERRSNTGETKEEKILKFTIHSERTLFEENSFSTPITQSIRINYLKKEFVENVSNFSEYRYKTSKEREKAANKTGALIMSIGIPPGVALCIWGVVRGDEGLPIFLPGLVLVLGTYFTGGGFFIWNPKEISEQMNEQKERVISSSEDWILTNSITQFENEPAINIPVRIEANHFEFHTIQGYRSKLVDTFTDDKGHVSSQIASEPYNWAFTGHDLLRKVESWETLQYVKSDVSSKVLSFLSEEMYLKEYPITIETIQMPSRDYSKVENDRAEIMIPGVEVHPDAVYSACRTFIDRKINSRIKQATIKLKNIDSHARISLATFEGTIVAPSKQGLLSPYFKEPLMDWASSEVLDYTVGDFSTTSGDDGSIVFSVYVPCTMELEITHPKYYFAKQAISFTEESLEKTIYMAELGTKMRVRVVDR